MAHMSLEFGVRLEGPGILFGLILRFITYLLGSRMGSPYLGKLLYIPYELESKL